MTTVADRRWVEVVRQGRVAVPESGHLMISFVVLLYLFIFLVMFHFNY